MKLPAGIKLDPEIMLGKPCVKGTRIPVYVLLQKMAAGETEVELLKAYPQLSKADIERDLPRHRRRGAEGARLSGP